MLRIRQLLSSQSWAGFLTDRRNRWVHVVVMSVMLVVHLATHYASYYPPFRELVNKLPYFRLHSLHEAEFILVIVYASLVLRLKGGLVAVAVSAISSLPFLLTPYVFGREPRIDELRDLAIQVAFVLVMGIVIVVLYEIVARERDRRLQVLEKLEGTNRQLTALNTTVQGQLNTLFGAVSEAIDQEASTVDALPPGPSRDRLAAFLRKLSETLGR
ncbi:MAG: hypothetical protein HYY31_05315 [Chloroflexi bacterium]|nr:hypothetical protein [Chloroflexota bacterium]